MVESALLDGVLNEVDFSFALVFVMLVPSACNPLRNVLVHEVLHLPAHTKHYDSALQPVTLSLTLARETPGQFS